MQRIVWIFIVTLGLCLSPVTAQNNANAVARIYRSKSVSSTLAFFAPGEATPRRKQAIFSGINVVFSPDGQWVAAYGLAQGSTSPQLAYGPIGQTPTQLTLQPGYYPVSAHFSASARYLSYTAASYRDQQWIMGIVDLANGNAIDFSGAHTNDPDAPERAGVAEALAWNQDDRSMLVATLQPGTSSIDRYRGIYSLDLSSLDFGQGTPSPLPPMKLLLPGDAMIGAPLISPDGARIAYFSSAPANPPENAALHKDSAAPNMLTILDALTGDDHVRIQAAKGQSIATAAWLPDSQTILYTAGGFKRTTYVVAAQAHRFDILTGQDTSEAILENDPRQYVFSTLICADSVFFVSKTFRPDFSGDATLYSAPLGNLSERSKPLATGLNIALLGCTQ